MFCPTSGYMLQLDAREGVARCPMTGYTKSLEGVCVCVRGAWCWRRAGAVVRAVAADDRRR